MANWLNLVFPPTSGNLFFMPHQSTVPDIEAMETNHRLIFNRWNVLDADYLLLLVVIIIF